MKYAIIQPYNKDYKPLEKITRTNIQQYCDKWNIELIRPQIYNKTYCSMHKFLKIISYQNQYDYLWGLDLDVLITDYTFDIFKLIRESDKDLHLCYTRENPPWPHAINMGSFLFSKNMVWSDYFQYNANDTTTHNDQGLCWKALAHDEAFKNRVKIHPFDLFNHKGSFLHHFCQKKDYPSKEGSINGHIQYYHLNHEVACIIPNLTFAQVELFEKLQPKSIGFTNYISMDIIDRYQKWFQCPVEIISEFKQNTYDLIIDNSSNPISTYLSFFDKADSYLVMNTGDTEEFFKLEKFQINKNIAYYESKSINRDSENSI